MATELVTALGFTVSVASGVPTSFDTTGYELLTFEAVEGVSSLDGDDGFTFNTQTASELNTGIQKSAKGVKTFPQQTIMVFDNKTSAGRDILDTAAAARRNEVSVKLEDTDGNIIYKTGIISGNSRTVGNADNIMMTSYPFTPNYEPIYVAAP